MLANFKRLVALVESGNYPPVQTGAFMKKYLARPFRRALHAMWMGGSATRALGAPVEVEQFP